MSDSSLVSIFFRIANFAVLAAVGYYAYRKYLKAPLEEKVNQKEAVLKGLEEQGYFLEGRAEDLDDQRIMQERRAVVLMQKVDEWHQAVSADRFKAHEENKLFAARSVDRVAVKNEYVAQHELKIHIAPVLIHDAKELLKKQFAEKKHNAEYVHDVVSNLKRKRA